MSWGISPNATEKEKIFADFNDILNGINSADGLSYHHYSCIYDIGRELADKEYQQGREDAIEEFETYAQKWADRQECIGRGVVKLVVKELMDSAKHLKETNND